MKPFHFLCDYSRRRVLMLLILLSALQLHGAASQSELPLNDWRQLWPQATYDAWYNKPETELQRLADGGHPAAQFILWQKWRLTHKEQAWAFLQAAVKAGLPEAMFEQGFSQLQDYSSPRTNRLAGWALLEQAAAGYPGAKINVAEYDAQFLSVMVPEGQPPLIRPNLERALEYFRDCAKLKHSGGMTHLALLYSSGIGEPRDETESPHNLLLGAARQGNAEAMTHLSNRYLYGHGETADLLQAARWRCFARLFAPGPEFVLLDENAEPKVQDDPARDELVKLLSLFVKTAEHHDSKAALALAHRYVQEGKPGEAVALLRTVKQWGKSAIAAELSKLEPTLTPEQKAIADNKSLFPFDRVLQLRP